MEYLSDYRKLQIHEVLHKRGGGGLTVGAVAKKVGLAKSYVWSVLQRMDENGEIDRVEVDSIDGHRLVLYYTRLSGDVLRERQEAMIKRMF